MESFNTPFKCLVHNGYLRSKPFELLEGITVVSRGVLVNVPVGYRSDFASIPRVFHRVLNPVGPYLKAAVVHDWLCDRRGVDGVSSGLAGEIFGDLMERCGVGKWTRKVMVFAVVKFGPKF